MFNRNSIYIKSVSEKKMDLGKLLLASSAAIAISASVAIGDPPIQEISLKPNKSDFANGVYVDYVEAFVPGRYLNQWEYKINNVLGEEKYNQDHALSLGHLGEVIVSYTKGIKNKDSALCFKRNDKGPTLYVHETNAKNNWTEKVEVFVTPDKDLNEKTKWVSLGVKSVEDGKDNWIPFDMNVHQAFHVKVKDAGGKKSNGTQYPGFDASAVLLANPCVPTS